MCSCTLSFLLSSFGGITRLVIYRWAVFLFPVILVAQVLVGAMGNTPPIWVWCWGHFCCYSLLMDFVHLRVGPCPGFCTSMHGIHSFRFTLSLLRFLSTSIFNFLLRDVHFYFWVSRWIFLPDSGEEEGDWIHGSIYDPRLYVFSRWTSFLATSYLSATISCLTCFDALHGSTSSDDFNSAHIDVQVWLWLVIAHRIHLFQAWTSSCDILFDVTFFI